MASVTRTAVTALQGGVGYELTGGEEWTPEAVAVTWDGTAAAGNFVVAVSFYNDGGALIDRAFPEGVTNAIGDTGRTFFRPFRRGGSTGGGYDTVQDEGVALPQETTLDFAGAGVTATDDAANGRTLVTIPGTSGGATYDSTVRATTGLFAYWPCQDTGTGAVDVVGGRDLLGDGATVYSQPGPFAGSTAIQSQGSTGFLSGTYGGAFATIFNGGNSFTVEGWWNLSGAQTAQSVLMFAYESAGPISPNITGVGGTALSTFAFTSSVNFAVSSVLLPANRWSHLAYSYDGANLRVYVNGVLGVTAALAAPAAGAIVQLGACLAANPSLLYGVAVYSVRLSDAVIAAHATTETVSGTTRQVVNVSAAYGIATGTEDIVVLASGTFTVTLPAASSAAGRACAVKNTGAGMITVSGAGTDQIDGAGAPGTISLAVAEESRTVVCDGLGWQVTGAYL